MKKIVLPLFILFPLFSHAASTQDERVAIANYQELCAKEQDPVKRQNYCHFLDAPQQKAMMPVQFRQDIAIG